MAREIHEREDLLRDAKALAPRALLRVELADAVINVFVGFRGESLSVYFGDDPAFHFNARGELRRAFIADRLIKAEGGRLVAMNRRRSDAEVELASTVLDAAQQERMLLEAARRFDELRTALGSDQWSLVGQFPEDGDAIARVRGWLDERRPLVVAKSPRVGG